MNFFVTWIFVFVSFSRLIESSRSRGLKFRVRLQKFRFKCFSLFGESLFQFEAADEV